MLSSAAVLWSALFFWALISCILTPAFAQRWVVDDTIGVPQLRHEACMVMAENGKIYLIGGRGMKNVNEYDPTTKTWRKLPWKNRSWEMHHMKCVAFRNKIYIAAAWYKAFPREENYSYMFIYDPKTNSWETRDFLPRHPDRRRGAAAFMLDEETNLMYLSHGTIGGHGVHAKTTGLIDVYDPIKDEWNPGGVLLPDAPNPRGHTGGAVIKGKVCVANGRDDSQKDFYNHFVAKTDCFDVKTKTWTVEESIPTPRAGGGVGKTCNNELVVLGGQGSGKAFDEMELFEPGMGWRAGVPMLSPRHASDMAVGACDCGFLFVASGNAGQGNSKGLTSTHRYVPAGIDPDCGARVTAAPLTSTTVPIFSTTTGGGSGKPVQDYLYVNAGSPSDRDDLASGSTRVYTRNGPSISGFSDRRFNSHRYGIGAVPTFRYTLRVTRARHLSLGFAESYVPNCGVGKRRFSVHVNGEIFMRSVDVFKTVGCLKPYEVSVPVRPNKSGNVVVEFSRGENGVQNPFVSYIQLGDPPVPTTRPTVTPKITTTTSATEGTHPKVRIDCGGVKDTKSALSGLSKHYRRPGQNILKSNNDPAFKSHRYGQPSETFSYTISAPQKRRVTLGFAENFAPNCKPKARTFSVSIGSTKVLPNIDVYSAVGCKTAYYRTFDALPDQNGNIVISFVSDGANNAFVSLIEIV